MSVPLRIEREIKTWTTDNRVNSGNVPSENERGPRYVLPDENHVELKREGTGVHIDFINVQT